jgi:CPA2 family monovalent cation:H+ antiporter-2
MSDFLLLAFILLTASIVAVPIASRFGLGSVLGYLIAGIAIGPLLAWLSVDVVSIQHFAEFGVVMMLFLVGLELNPQLLWKMRAKLLGLGGAQVLLTIIVITGIALLLGLQWRYALAIGFILTLSSTAIVLQTLNEKGLMKSDGGECSFSVLLFQDIAVIPILAFLPLLAAPELASLAHPDLAFLAGAAAESDTGSISMVENMEGWQTGLVTIGAIAAIIFGGNYLAGPLFHFVSTARLRELFTATALVVVIGIALLMTLVGLSPALGAFLAGVVLANSEYRHELEADIAPFRGMLLGLFFITVGAGINFSLLASDFTTIIALTLGLIAVKSFLLYILGGISGLKGCARWLFALGLAQAGEFGFVLLSFSTANNVLPQGIADQLLLVVALSMLLTPPMFIFYDKVIAPYYARGQAPDDDVIEEDAQIIIAGRGRVGGIVDRMLGALGHSATVIDYSSRQLNILRTFGMDHTYFGDATRPDLLMSAGIDNAKLLIVAIDGRDQINAMVEYVVRNFPNVHVVARAVDRDHVYELWARGCRDIIRETYDSSLRIGRSAFEALGVSRDKAERLKDVFQNVDGELMVHAADAYKLDIPAWENEDLVDLIKQQRPDWERKMSIQMQAILNENEDDKPD